jgi:hypothetical protein
MVTIIMTKSVHAGRVVRIIPVNSGFIAAPSQPSAWAEK